MAESASGSLQACADLFAEFTAFLAIAETGTFTSAAKRLNVSTATISTSIHRLEEHLGVRLLNRTTRSVSLTQAGDRLLQELRPLLQRVEATLESLNAFRTTPSGHLRLLAPPPVAQFQLAPLLARFRSAYPNVTVEVEVQSVLADVWAGFDASFRRADMTVESMATVRLTREARYFTVASPDYVAAHGAVQTPFDLKGHSCIRLRIAGNVIFPWRYLVGGKLVEFEVSGPLIVNDPKLMLVAASSGAGLAYVLEDYVGADIAEGRLLPMLADQSPTLPGFCLFYPRDPPPSAALKALIDFLERADPDRRP